MQISHFFEFENTQTKLIIAPIDTNILPTDTLPPIRHISKQKEYIISRKLLRYIIPNFPFEKISLLDSKKPIFSDRSLFFSLSHTKNYCAAIVSNKIPVSIDIQEIIPKLGVVAHKFLHEEEQKIYLQQSNPLLYLAILWTLKETLYKFFYPNKLNFKAHIFAQPHIPHHMIENTLYTPEITLTHTALHPQISRLKIRYFLHKNTISSFIIS